MASNVVTSPTGTLGGGTVLPLLKRGVPAVLGSLAANSDVVAFVLPVPSMGTDGTDVLVIVTSGGTVTGGLEASLDGTNWFGVLPRAALGTAPNFTATVLNSDTAVSSANAYDVSGLQGGAQFRFGGRSAGTAVVTALIA